MLSSQRLTKVGPLGKTETLKSWYFISDAHLCEHEQDRQEILIRFLDEKRDQMEALVILGDLFDFWFGFRGYVDPAYRPLCDTLRS
jgi:UDP-2,3-diacylglucosamine hydrolase